MVANSDVIADPKARDIDFLDSYAYERWECILHYMVGSKHEGISSDAVRVLLNAGLMVSNKLNYTLSQKRIITFHTYRLKSLAVASPNFPHT
jgi:hypothetical protein